MLWTVNYYDGLGRLTKVFKQNFIGGSYSTNNYYENSTQYDFTNQPIETLKIHRINNNEIVRVENGITYDHIGRKTRIREKINNASQWTVISKVYYNELGQVMNEKVSAPENEQNYLKTIAETYNERGWLKN